MRGAGLRLNNDVRRLWRCAACGAERKVGAQATTVNCQCAGRPAMKLVEGMRRERPLKELTTTYMEFEFEPGELAPPRPRKEEEVPVPNSDTKLEFEIPAARTPEVVADEAAPAAGDDVPPPAPSQRPPRPNERRGDRGPRPQRGPQGRQENRSDNRPRREGSGPRDQQPRRDQPPRREPRDPQTPQPENTSGENAVPTDGPVGAPAGKRRRNRRGNRGGNPSSPSETPNGRNSDNASFGEGIPDQSPAPTQE
ncbi:MAG: hypothetical protein U0929_07670 [Planctomycetaceae bacterium]